MEQKIADHDRKPGPTREGRVGLELEFAGLSERAAAEAVALSTAGVARETAPHRWAVETEAFGTCEVYLDTQFADTISQVAGENGLALARQIVPVEVVTEPFPIRHLPEFDLVTDALRLEGASGSRDGLFFGFGTHVNIEVDTDDVDLVVSRLCAYALIEEFLRQEHPIDISRRVLPFVSPYPDSLVNALAEHQPRTKEQLLDLYLHHAPSRDHGLDLLPILALYDAERVRSDAEGMTKVKARPAFHFRLPDCRVDEEGWSVLDAWDDWSLVEAVADDPDLLADLCQARRDWIAANAWQRAPWFKTVFDVLS
ncbi:amidoligase family protein [Tropicimonas sp. S265A]|uniref:amidoligase family protein n=1 Tax=Tropicimonas sp. S265A TaxID=3415134 RepID=UPI003C79A7F8